MSEFAEGDVVELKSGGVPMVIREIDGEKAFCVWQDDKGKHFEHAYPLIVLRKYDPMLPIGSIG